MRAVRIAIASAAVALGALCLAAASEAAGTVQLTLDQSAAFSILGHSCGGIQEQVYATGFASDGYPTGDVYMSTSCGGSGRGGGYKSTKYAAWATVEWDWFGATRAYAKLTGTAEGISTTFSAEDSHGDRIYNVGTSAYLEASSPPLTPPGAPTEVSAEYSPVEAGEEQEPTRRFIVRWTAAPETAAVITSSTVTATPVGSGAPVITTTVSGPTTSAVLEPLVRDTTYSILVTSADGEGTSQPSAPIEAFGGTHAPPTLETCEQLQGTIKLSPGLEEAARAQTATLKGKLLGCNGKLDLEGGTFTAHLGSAQPLGCATLAEPYGEPLTGTITVKWSPEGGSSTGTLSIPLSEVPGFGLTGSLAGGALTEQQPIAASVYESFTGGPGCAVSTGKKKAKAVKAGTISAAGVELGG